MENIFSHSLGKASQTIKGLAIYNASSEELGIALAKEALYYFVDKNSLLFISGGKTPKKLYEILVNEKKLRAGAVAMVDERYGPIMHKDSNEKMIQDSGFITYLKSMHIPFYPVLEKAKNRIGVARDYDSTITSLFKTYKKRIGLFGIGVDGHTAGIIPNRSDFKNPIFTDQNRKLVGEFNDKASSYKERITITPLAIEKMDYCVLLTLGKEKKETLGKLFEDLSIETIPSRIFLRPSLVRKTILITDQVI
jgi:6-phosphogluconolactonase/glucosamine-6-phosphate isomerase/deaminase